MARTLTHEEARRVYDRIGAWQDTQGFYEDRAVDIAVAHGRFDAAERVFELGCGTGRLAARLLAEHLPPHAQYVGVDISPEMARLARERLARFGARARVRLTEGGLPLAVDDGWADRFVSTYVLDLLSEGEMAAMVAEARRVLRPGGLLCLVSLTTGAGPFSRVLAGVWGALHALSPRLVGGCRPVDLEDHVRQEDGWKVRHRERVAPFGVPSEVLVAERT